MMYVWFVHPFEKNINNNLFLTQNWDKNTPSHRKAIMFTWEQKEARENIINNVFIDLYL